MADYRTFVVAYDFSDHARAALEVGLDLAKRFGADLHLVHVVQPPVYPYPVFEGSTPPIDLVELRRRATEALEQVSSEIDAESSKVHARVIEGSAIAEVLCRTAEELGADLIVMGTHGRTGLAHVFLGSVAERTLRRSTCPVLAVPAAE